jgi:hypothetical protein
MTPKITKRVTVPRAKKMDYAQVAESFYNGAEMAKGFEYWNAAGLLIVHAAIANTDALTIKFGGVRSKGEDHMAAVDLLRQVMALGEQGRAGIRHLEKNNQRKEPRPTDLHPCLRRAERILVPGNTGQVKYTPEQDLPPEP